MAKPATGGSGSAAPTSTRKRNSYTTEGTKASGPPPKAPRTRTTHWTNELAKLKGDPDAWYKYPFDNKSQASGAGANLHRKDYHVEYAVADDPDNDGKPTLWVKWNPNATKPKDD